MFFKRMINWIEPKNQHGHCEHRFNNRTLLNMMVPILIEQLLVLLVGIADTLMVSYAGEAAVSGVSLINQINTIFIMVFTALASGGAVVISQYIGRKDQKYGNQASDQLMTLLLGFGIFFTAFVLLFGDAIFRFLFGQVDHEVYTSAMIYFQISAYSFTAMAIYQASSAIYRSFGNTKTIMQVSLGMNLINVVGNAIGIFILHAGVAGVAYPSFISRVFAAVMMFIFVLDRRQVVFVSIKKLFSLQWQLVRQIFSIAIPNSIESGLFQISKVVLSTLVAGFGTMQIAANGIAQSFWSLAALFSIAMGPVFITVIGQTMGAKQIDEAEYYLIKLTKMTYVGSVFWDLITLILTPLFLSFYSLTPQTAHLIFILVLIHNIGNALFSPLAFPLSNGLRAAGDVRFTMYSSLFATCIVRVAFSYILGLWFHLGVIGIALAMVIDWFIKAMLMVWRLYSDKWKEFQVIS